LENRQEIHTLLEQASEKWMKLLKKVRDGKSVVKNIIQGLKLQKLKVDFYETLDGILKAFETGDGIRVPNESFVSEMKEQVKDLRGRFELEKYRTKELYEKIIYDSEIDIELAVRFDRPMEFIDEVLSRISSIVTVLDQFDSKVSELDISSGTDFGVFIDKWNSADSELYLVDLERLDEQNIGEILGSEIEQIIRRFLDVIDNLLFWLSREKLQSSYIRRF
jgi:hypothetical protein